VSLRVGSPDVRRRPAASEPSSSEPSTGARRAWWIGGGTVTALLVLVAGLHLAAVAVGGREIHDTLTYQLPVRLITIEATGDVVVRRTPASSSVEIKVERRRYARLITPSTSAEREGDTVRLTGRCRAPFGVGRWGCGVSFEVRVPPGVSIDVRTQAGEVGLHGLTSGVTARTLSGDVSATGVRGPVSLSTGSGDVSLDDVGGGTIDADTGSGRITGRGLTADDVGLSTGSGAVVTSFRSAPRRVDVRTGSGLVVLGVPGPDTYDVALDTGSGDQRIGVRTDPLAPRTIRARTGSGDIEVNYNSP
jgi:hypothetical protein